MNGSDLLEKEVRNYILHHHLLEEGEKILVAVSGGADSVALLLLLKHLGYDCHAAHCNFHLRGEESDRDRHFVEELCRKQQIPLHLEHFQTRDYATKMKISVEMAAREQRYHYFNRLLEELAIHKVAVAHHRRDQAETLFINLIRGTGIHGLRGMCPSQGNVIRPLLNTDKADLLTYLQELGQDYVTDSTNLAVTCLRNKIRLEILPALQNINPSVVDNIVHTMEHLNDTENIYMEWMQQAFSRIIQEQEYILGQTPVTLSVSHLKQNKYVRTICHELLSPYGFNSAQEKTVLSLPSGTSGREFYSSSWCLLVNREQWQIISLRDKDHPDKFCVQISSSMLKVPEQPVCLYEEGQQALYGEWLPVEKLDEIRRDQNYAYVDADKIKFPLTLRYAAQGDRFVPFGMKGSRLLSDFLTDIKLSRWQKEKQWVLQDANDRMIWVVGQRADDRFRITSKTQSVYRFSLVIR